MCGICGAFHYREGQPDGALVRRQLAVLAHRGPDDSGVWTGDGAALGHARLSIRDLSPGGHQPMPNEDESLWLVCNGEFYGIDPIRDRLVAGGHRLRGASDSELALHLYEEHGDELLAHLRGMFAFALFDRTRRRLVVARDRLGKKPLYWHDDGRRVAFASELKALLADPAVGRDVDATSIADYLALRYVPAPRTPWRGVCKLEPGHVLVADEHGVRVRPYWALPVAPRGGPRPSDADAIAGVRARIEESVRLRLVSDVPVGAFLSGGMDSAAVLSVMTRVVGAPVKAYTVGYEGIEDDESAAARELAAHLHTEHHTLMLGPEALRALPELVWQADEPFADPSIVPTHFVAKRAREDVTVVLTGDGGDEVFAGYKTYPAAARHARLAAIPGPLRSLAALPAAMHATGSAKHKRFSRIGMSVLERHLDAMECFAERGIGDVLAPEFARTLEPGELLAPLRARFAVNAAAHGEVESLVRLDTGTYLPDDVLHKVDRASMLHALEVRSPLLDQELVEYAATLPFDLKLRGDVTKWVLRQAVAQLMPGDHAKRPKQGFNPPLVRWLSGPGAALAADVLGDPRTAARGWLAPAALARYRQPQSGGGDVFRQWSLLCLELWARTYVDRPREELASPIAW
jgi:asparagine synthase (glutamine-hydrolysing)